MKENKKEVIQKPILTLNSATKFYLATRELTNEEDELFFIISLFMPVKNGLVFNQAFTEISTFEDAKSANVYLQTLSKYCTVNAKTQIGQSVKDAIKDFYTYTK